jgi:tetratricopeptide (TPR) repeat protein
MDDITTLLKSADNALQREKYIDAIRDYLKAIELIKDSDPSTVGDVYYKVSQAYSALEPKNIENSMKYAKMALDIHGKSGEKDLEIVDRLNMFYILMDAGKFTESGEELERALTMARETGDEGLVNMVLLAKAELLGSHKGNEGELLKIYNDVMESSKKIGDWDSYFEAKKGIIEDIRKHGNAEDALTKSMESLNEIDQISAGIKNKKERKEFRSSLSYIYDIASDISMEMGNVDDAIKIAQRLSE